MRRSLPAVLLAGAALLSACGGDTTEPAPANEETTPATAQAARFPEQVRGTFLDSCVENATQTAGGSASEQVLQQTCECILGRVEKEYTQTEFAAFEQRLLGGTASAEESGRLTAWSTACAEDATG
jgi:hypothetical protein